MTSNKACIWRISSVGNPAVCANLLLKIIAASLKIIHVYLLTKFGADCLLKKNRIYYAPKIAFVVHLWQQECREWEAVTIINSGV